MKNTQPKLTLSQETLRILVDKKPAKSGNNPVSTHPMCPLGAGASGRLR